MRKTLACLLLAVGGLLSAASAQDTQGAQGPAVEPTLDQLRELRALLMEYENVENAIADGFEQFGACMSSAQGAQGVHFTHAGRIEDPAVDFMQPEMLMYEPRADGSLRLIGIELLVFQEDWHAAGNEPVPVQLGREFGINMTLLERPFYALHAWVWQHNPSGFYANWNPLVTCEFEAEQAHAH